MIALNTSTRKLVLKNYLKVCRDRSISINLSGTTKLLKKMPSHIANRLSSIKVKLKPDSRTERIDRFIAFITPL